MFLGVKDCLYRPITIRQTFIDIECFRPRLDVVVLTINIIMLCGLHTESQNANAYLDNMASLRLDWDDKDI